MREWLDASDDEIRLSTAIGFLTDLDSDLRAFIFDPTFVGLRKRPGILRDESWRFDVLEQSKVRVALDIWSGSGHIMLFEMLEQWDGDSWILFMKALCLLKGIDPGDISDGKITSMSRFLGDRLC